MQAPPSGSPIPLAVLGLSIVGAVVDYKYKKAGGRKPTRQHRVVFLVLVVAIVVFIYWAGTINATIAGEMSVPLIIFPFAAWELGRWRIRSKFPLPKPEAKGLELTPQRSGPKIMTSKLVQPVEPHFYKYSPLAPESRVEWLRDIILKHELYVPTRDQLNDWADGLPKFAMMPVEELTEFHCSILQKLNPGASEEELSRMVAEVRASVPAIGSDTLMRKTLEEFTLMMNGYRIYSMTRTYGSMNLWATYAADHTGYCLEFANSGPFFTKARNVVYGERLAVKLSDPSWVNADFFFHKGLRWQTEDEVRILVLRGGAPKVTIEPHLLTRLILGEKIREEHEVKIRQWARERTPELVVVKPKYDPFREELVLP